MSRKIAAAIIAALALGGAAPAPGQPACRDMVFTGVAGTSPMLMAQYASLVARGADENDILARNPIGCRFGTDQFGLTGASCRGLHFFSDQPGRYTRSVMGYFGVQTTLDLNSGRHPFTVWVSPRDATCESN